MSAHDLPDLNLVVTEMELQFDRLIEQRAHDRKVIAELLAALKEAERTLILEGYESYAAEGYKSYAALKVVRAAIALAENR